MKIRGRLMIAFLLLTLFPVLLIAFCSNLILSNQAALLGDRYQSDTSGIVLLLEPIHFLYSATKEDFKTLTSVADANPDKFRDSEYIERISKELAKRSSFLIILDNENELYVGDEEKYAKIDTLPGFHEYQSGYSDLISIDPKIPCLIKEKDFYFSDRTEAQLFLITDLSGFFPSWRQLVRQLILSLLLTILITAFLLMAWLYNSIVRPLTILRIATMQIGAGNLNTPVRVTSTDEIGELCRDFEEMRIRLKEMIDERMQYEKDTREMISSMAHDLQTPLTSIKGYSEGLMEGVANTPEKQEKYLRTIYAKASDMSYLVDELSIFAKVEQNGLTYHFLPLNLNEYFTDCMEEFSLDLETKHIEILFENKCKKDTCVYADPEQLKRVIQNIIGNAQKYLDKPEGKIRIVIEELPTPEPVAPLYRQLNPDGTVADTNPPPKLPDAFVQVSITDNGPGIAAKDLPYIFHRFYRADASRNSSKRGSGLGLAIVERIVSDHGGRVWAESEPGNGTSIFFTLKIHRA